MKLLKKIAKSYQFVKENKGTVNIPLLNGYALVSVYNKSADVKYWQDTCLRSDLDCIDKKTGKILFLCHYYFDDGTIYEFVRVWAYDFKEAVANGLDLRSFVK